MAGQDWWFFVGGLGGYRHDTATDRLLSETMTVITASFELPVQTERQNKRIYSNLKKWRLCVDASRRCC